MIYTHRAGVASLRQEPGRDWYSLQAKQNERRAELHIYDVIAWYGVDAATLVRDLAAAGELDQIDVFINSPGGSAFDGMAIYNALRRNKATVNVTVDGLAASAASLIAMAGDTVTMMRGSELMVHDAWGFAQGNAKTMVEAAEMLDKLSDSYADCYAARAGGDPAAWREVMRNETWYSAAEAVEAGLADRTDDAKDAAEAKARFDLTVFAHAGRDRAPAPVLPTVAALPDPPAHSEPGQPNRKDVDMSDTLMAGLRERLGMTDAETSEDAVLAALDEALAEQADPTPALVAALPEGVVAVEKDQLDELKTAAAEVRAIRDEQTKARREALVSAAVKDGRIAPARAEHWVKQLNADEEGASAVLASLEPGTIPVAEVGHSDDVDTDDAFYAKWKGTTTTEEDAR